MVLNHGDRESHPFVLTSIVAEKCAVEKGKRFSLTVECKDDAIQMFEIMSRGDDMVSIIPE
jgi:hypothetical protein